MILGHPELLPVTSSSPWEYLVVNSHQSPVRIAFLSGGVNPLDLTIGFMGVEQAWSKLIEKHPLI